MLSLPLSLCVALFSVLSIVGDRPNNRTLHYIFKPLTMLLMIGASLLIGIADNTFAYWMLAGLCLSLIGDVFLMLPSDRFIQGLASFLLAHIAYIIGFYQLYDGSFTIEWLFGVVVVSAVFYRLLAKHLSKLKLPVLVYVSVISVMVWLAGELYFSQQNLTNSLLIGGALVFAVSDAALAWNKFKQPFSWAQWLILSTYFLAQWLFVQALLSN